MNGTPQTVAIFVGVLSIGLGAFGLHYNASSLLKSWKGNRRGELPHFRVAFYIMTGICAGCESLLIWCGLSFVRLQFHLCACFAILMVFEVLYFITVARCWLEPGIGRSVAAATGVANGGLTMQFILLFPVWAPCPMMWAKGQ